MRDLRELLFYVEPTRPEHATRRPSPSAEAIREFENYAEIKLPEDYKWFLGFWNGGLCELHWFVPKGRDSSHIWNVDHFYYLDESREGDSNLWKIIDIWRPEIGEGTALPIADEPFGNQIYLDTLYDPAKVKIYVYDSGGDRIDVADSFSEFIDLLQKRPPEAGSP